MKRIGVFGGSFDPVHLGHLVLAEAARTELLLDQVIFVPAGQSPFKGSQPLLKKEERLFMLEEAVKGNPFFFISTEELERKPPSYTIETMEYFSRLYPDPENELYLLIGGDHLESFHLWRDYRRLLTLCRLGVGARPGSERRLPSIVNDFKEQVTFFSNPLIALSSQEIKEKIRAGKSVRYLLPEGVREYILKHRLYTIEP